MPRLYKTFVFAALGFAVMTQTSWASRAFVTDTFTICLRRGPSNDNKILKLIPSSLPVEVQETKDGWSRVRLLENNNRVKEGWVLSRYLVNRLPWEDQAKNLKEENTQLKETLATVNQEFLEEMEEFQSLKKDYEATRNNAQRLSEENEMLKSSTRHKWFTTGGLVLFSGLVVGLLIGKQPKRRRLSF
jgi:SH3 domain protein